MPALRFNKLVRDNPPEIYAELGQTITTHQLTDIEYRQALRDKIIEEAKELSIADAAELAIVDKLADLQQDLDDSDTAHGITRESIIIGLSRKNIQNYNATA